MRFDRPLAHLLLGAALIAGCGTSTSDSGSSGTAAKGGQNAPGEPEAVPDPAAERPKCRPEGMDAAPTTPIPWSEGAAGASGWKVASIDRSNHEFVRVSFEKDGASTQIEVAYNADGPGDWSTDAYRLMPAPDATPPEDLLNEQIALLREWNGKSGHEAFVSKREGAEDAFAGLPPCDAAGMPIPAAAPAGEAAPAEGGEEAPPAEEAPAEGAAPAEEAAEGGEH